jgi:hypothetical protein
MKKLFENIGENKFKKSIEEVESQPQSNQEGLQYYIQVAKANGFDSITSAITYAVKAKKLIEALKKL